MNNNNKYNKKQIITAVGILLLSAVLVYYVYTHDPGNKENVYVSCTFKTLTGWDCSGCGGQRALYHLLHFEFLDALRYNAFFVLLIPYLALLFYYEIRRMIWKTPVPRNFFTSGKMVWIFLAVLFLFGILRNLPFFPFNWLATPDG